MPMEKRYLYKQLVESLSSKRHTIVVGPRQVGKTTLIKQLYAYCNEQGYPTVYLDLEHRDVRVELDKNPNNVFLFCPSTTERIYVFLDEIQKLKDPSNFLKQLYDDYSDGKRIKIVATGSSAFYIDERFNDSLAGRKRVFVLYSCSFEESLLIGGKDDLYEEVMRLKMAKEAKSVMLPRIRQSYYEYMRFGGYPEVVTETNENEKIEILRDLKDSFVKKDVEESGVRDEDAFFRLFRSLAIQAGGLTNVNELSKELRLKDETVSRYIGVMEKCFHVAMVRPFHRNLTKELTKMPMTYFFDSGMRNVLLNSFHPYASEIGVGQMWENQVFRSLVDRYGVENIRFWRTTEGREVDFVMPDLEVPVAIEVKKSANAAKESKYKSFRDTYPEIQFRFVCLEPFTEDVVRL